MKRKMILFFVLAMLISVAGKAKAQDGSEYLLWEKTPQTGMGYRGAEFNIDETKLAVLGGYENETYCFKILEVSTSNELFSTPFPYRPDYVHFTSDGKYLLVGGTHIYDAKTYELLKVITPGGSVSISPDCKRMILSSGLKFRIFSLENFELIKEITYPDCAYDQKPVLGAFFTPNGKYIIMNRTLTRVLPKTEIERFNEVFDANTYQKLDKSFEILKTIRNFSKGGGLVIKGGQFTNKSGTKVMGFQIFDWEKDSLVWEQETKNYNGLTFIHNDTYLISNFSIYESGNPDMSVFKTWDLTHKTPSKDIKCVPTVFQNISKSDRYLIRTNSAKLWLFDFEKMFEGNVSVNTPEKSIEINITTNPDSNLIKIDNLNSGITNVAIYDLSGNLVDTIFKGNSLTNTIEYNTSHLSKGVYLVKIDTNKESFTKKIIIE